MWVGIHVVIVDWIGLGQSASGLGWIGFSKMDPCLTLVQTQLEKIDLIVKKRRLKWLGHVLRMDSRLPRQAVQWDISGWKRKSGRPRKNWIDTVQRDLNSIDMTWELSSATARCQQRRLASTCGPMHLWPELSTGWVYPQVGSGRVGLRICSFRWVGLGWVEYDKSTIFLDDYTAYNCKGSCKLNTRGYEKFAFFDHYLAVVCRAVLPSTASPGGGWGSGL